MIRWKDECSKCQGQIGFLKLNLQDFQITYSFRQWYYDQPRQHIKKQRHYSANKGLSSQSYSFSSGHVWIRELDCEESWASKNWCFWTVVLEKALESPLDCKEIQPGMVLLKPVLWPPHAKSWFIEKDSDAGRDWGQEEKGTTEDEMAGSESAWTPGVGDGQGSLVCCDSWGRKELDMTERLNGTENHCRWWLQPWN